MNLTSYRSEKLNTWYEEKLHLHRNADGEFAEAHLEMQSLEVPAMLSFQVERLAPLLNSLAGEGVRIVDRIDDTPRGKFAWIFDPEGNKVELWEAPDESQSLIDLPEPD